MKHVTSPMIPRIIDASASPDRRGWRTIVRRPARGGGGRRRRRPVPASGRRWPRDVPGRWRRWGRRRRVRRWGRRRYFHVATVASSAGGDRDHAGDAEAQTVAMWLPYRSDTSHRRRRSPRRRDRRRRGNSPPARRRSARSPRRTRARGHRRADGGCPAHATPRRGSRRRCRSPPSRPSASTGSSPVDPVRDAARSRSAMTRTARGCVGTAPESSWRSYAARRDSSPSTRYASLISDISAADALPPRSG